MAGRQKTSTAPPLAPTGSWSDRLRKGPARRFVFRSRSRLKSPPHPLHPAASPLLRRASQEPGTIRRPSFPDQPACNVPNRKGEIGFPPIRPLSGRSDRIFSFDDPNKNPQLKINTGDKKTFSPTQDVIHPYREWSPNCQSIKTAERSPLLARLPSLLEERTAVMAPNFIFDFIITGIRL